MNLENNVQITDKILTCLEEKYHTEFTVKEIYKEFDGMNGISIRALCFSKDFSDEFVVYCTQEDVDEDDFDEVDLQKYNITDEYVEVLLQNILLSKFTGHSGDNIFVRCRVVFRYEQPMFKADWQSSLMNADAYIKIYIVTDGVCTDSMQELAEKLLKKYSPHTGYVYYVVKKDFDVEQIQQTYDENQFDFGNYLISSDFAERIEFTLYSEKILQDKRVIKE